MTAPVVGSAVLFVDAEGVTRAATVTHVYEGEAGLVDLTYLTRIATTVHPVREADYDPTGNSPMAWRWPA